MLNRFEAIGHIGKQAEVRVLEGGVKVAQFSIGITKRGYTDKAGNHIPDRTTWVNIVAWRGLAELVEKWTDKGSHIYVAGELSTRSYDKDGQTRYVTEIIAENIELLGRKPETQQAEPQADKSVSEWANQQQQTPQPAAPDFSNTGDLPF